MGLSGVWREEAIKTVSDVLEGDHQLAEDVVDAMGECVPVSFAGLLAILEANYPADVFTGTSGDPGAHIIALTRLIVEHRMAIKNAGSIKVQPGYEKVAEAKHRADERLWKAVDDA